MFKKHIRMLPISVLLALCLSLTAFASTNPATGDSSNLGFIFALLGVSLVVLVVVVVITIKKNKR